jgi:hypothetical protein
MNELPPESKNELGALPFEDFWKSYNNFHQYFLDIEGLFNPKINSPAIQHLARREPDLHQKLVGFIVANYKGGYVEDEALEKVAHDLYKAYLVMREVESDEALFR